jgi:hypothetical protein
MQWISVNQYNQQVVSSQDTYLVTTVYYDDGVGIYTWNIVPQRYPDVSFQVQNTAFSKPQVEAAITTFESQPIPPPDYPSESSS